MKDILAVCPGSFDPVTVGHLDIIRRAAAMYPRLIVVVMINAAKAPSFSPEERVDMLQQVMSDLPNVIVDVYDGLLADYMRQKQANVIIKGLRAMSDFEYEFQQALINKRLYGAAETSFLITSADNMYLSSSLVRTIASMGGDIGEFVPAVIAPKIQEKLYRKDETK